MIRKATVFLATYNKNECLPNTLVSIAWQKTTFPFEVCIVDDHSDVDPEPIFKEYLSGIEWSYMRLPQHVGFKTSQCYCFQLMSEDSEAVVLQSSDVIHGSPFMIQKLCEALKPRHFTMPEVRNLRVSSDLHQAFEVLLPYYLTDYAMTADPCVQMFYSGPRQPDPAKRWYFFLGAILKDDLLSTTYPTNCYDKDFSNELHKKGFTPLYLQELIGIHQRH